MPHPRVWKPFILVASYVFYAAASVGYAALLAGITLANQAAAVLIARAPTERARKALVAAIVAVDLGALGVFKYYGFFAEEIARSLDVDRARHAVAAAGARAADRPELHHVPGDLLRGRRQARAAAAGVDDRLRALPVLLPARRRRPDRAGARVHPAARHTPRPAQRRRGRRRRADRARAGQEGGDRRLPRPQRGRRRVRGAAGLRGARRRAGRVRLRGADLLRLLRLHGHRDRPRAAARVRLPAELQQPLPGDSASPTSGAAGT